MSCSSHQKQVLIAMHLYNDANGTFPPGARSSQLGTWALHIAPFIEQTAVASAYDFDVSYIKGSNVEVLSNCRVPVYSCPTDSFGLLNPFTGAAFTSYYSHNYVVCMGRDGVYDPTVTNNGGQYASQSNLWIDDVSLCHPSQYRALFALGGQIGKGPDIAQPEKIDVSEVIDGLSNTVALSETILGRPPGSVQNDLRGMIWYGGNCFFTTNQSPNTTVADVTLSYDQTGHTQHPLQKYGTSGGGAYRLRWSARSWHTHGVNAALGDGSVRFVNNQVDLDVWRAAGSTNGSETASLP
jgi:hypothetical protein